jgi:MFS transporter, DHA1 family, inner membrane transport protein
VIAASEETRVVDAALLIGAGVVAACQVGKAFIAMPLIIADLHIGLGIGSMILAVVAFIGALGAMPVSMVLRRLGPHRALIFGLVAIGIGSAIGAVASGAAVLIVSRAVEGLGLLATVLVIPDLLQQTVAPRDRDLMLAIWGSYMPIGTVVMLLLGPALPEIGWRALWGFNAILPIAYAVLCFFRFGLGERGERGSSLLSDVEALFRAPACRYLALAFALYSFSYVAIAGFMPLILVTQLHLSVAVAGLFTTAAVAANVVGNIMAGILLRAGIPIWANVAMSFTVYGIASLIIFASGAEAGVIAGTAAITLGLGGLSPGSIFAAVPRFAPTPALITPTVGLIQQASNIGQFIGPLATGSFAAHFGWSAVPFVMIPVACAGLAIAAGIRNAGAHVECFQSR